MADGAKKVVDSAILDTWSRGDSILSLITDKTDQSIGADTYETGYFGAFTVGTSETLAVQSTTLLVDTVIKNRKKFINQALTQNNYMQLLNGNEAYARELMRACGGNLVNSMERDLVEYWLGSIAGASVNYHANIDGNAVTDDDVAGLEATVREADGIAKIQGGLFWLLSPRSQASIKTVTEYIPLSADSLNGNVGTPLVARVNGIPAYMNNNVPGQANASRMQAVISASNVATNVVTVTVPTGHGFQVGQQVFTTGLSTNVAVSAPATVTSVTATTVVFALTAANGSVGTGILYGATAMALLCYSPWLNYGLDYSIPFSALVKLSGDAGWTVQMYNQMGRGAHAGAVGVLHCPDGI